MRKANYTLWIFLSFLLSYTQAWGDAPCTGSGTPGCAATITTDEQFIDCVLYHNATPGVGTIRVGTGRQASNPTLITVGENCTVDLRDLTIELDKAVISFPTPANIILNASTEFTLNGNNAKVILGPYTFIGNNRTPLLSLNQLNAYIDQSVQNGQTTLSDVLNVINLAFPVDLISFTARAESQSVALQWATASEENNDYFLLEHSSDGQKFESIARLPGAGSTLELQAYRYLHSSPTNGLNYYRLSQVDYDGATAFFDVLTVEWKGQGNEWTIQPNPAHDFIELDYSAPPGQSARATLYSLTGKEIKSLLWDAGSRNRMDLPPGLPRGIYLLRLERGREVVTRRVVVQ